MTLPLRFVLPLADAALPPGLDAAAMPAATVRLVAVHPRDDAVAVTALAAACRTAVGPQAGHFSPAGLVGELASRAGRRVHGWLAWPGDADRVQRSPPAAVPPACPLGLVTLVVVTGDGAPRCSIGWLLVHPAARRHGIARRLVAAAVAAAAVGGAREVAAETLETWPAAVAFWSAAGFRAVSR